MFRFSHLTVAAVLMAVAQSGLAGAVPKFAIITVPNGGTWGNWGGLELCPENSQAVGFSLKVEPNQGGADDDTALNGIALECFDATTFTLTEIKSAEGEFGFWGPRVTCLGGGFLTSFSLRVEAEINGDNTAANDANFKCNTGELLEGHGMNFGVFGEWSTACNNGICGMETRVEGRQGSRDDTSLNDVKFLCC